MIDKIRRTTRQSRYQRISRPHSPRRSPLLLPTASHTIRMYLYIGGPPLVRGSPGSAFHFSLAWFGSQGVGLVFGIDMAQAVHMKKGGRWVLGLHDGIFLQEHPRLAFGWSALGGSSAVASLHFVFFLAEWRWGRGKGLCESLVRGGQGL
ncbi:hypothetical protein F5883DRAFT_108532 [Diaporthe sp. PMI_573]|nr:hypothetical protein F5883DRAFT_108532 [Diaporthaceae sp. PMI_573]